MTAPPASAPAHTIAVLAVPDPLEWRCRCPVRMLHGYYTPTGGLYVAVALRRGRHIAYWAQVSWAEAHCMACHGDEELTRDESGTLTARQVCGPRELSDCPVCFVRGSARPAPDE